MGWDKLSEIHIENLNQTFEKQRQNLERDRSEVTPHIPGILSII